MELSLFLQFLLMHQSLVALLGDHWEQFDGLAYNLEYSSVQQLIKVDVLYWLHHADKQGKRLAQEKNLLLKIREVVCDWLGQKPPPPSQEYKLRSKQRSSLTVAYMQRSVPLSMCQVFHSSIYSVDYCFKGSTFCIIGSLSNRSGAKVLSAWNSAPSR